MTVRCGWCGRKLQRKDKAEAIQLCREHEKHRPEFEKRYQERSAVYPAQKASA